MLLVQLPSCIGNGACPIVDYVRKSILVEYKNWNPLLFTNHFCLSIYSNNTKFYSGALQ
jgi:hypothetical protein